MSDIRTEKILYKNPESGTTIIRVYNDKTEQRYVIKKILYLDNPLYRTIFDKEIGALKKVRQSENIVKLLGHQHGKAEKSGQAMGLISLEYVAGDTLQKSCNSVTKISDKYSIIKQLISALRCAHENGIIHRDVNPNNIMLTNDFFVKLIDFGICKIKGASHNRTTHQYATNKYAAPEVRYHSENATERSDIYSLGCVIYFLFTKCEPSLPAEIADTIEKSSGMDPILKDVLCKMTACDPEDRFENMIDLEIAFAALYNKYLSNDEVYSVFIDSGNIDFLRRNNLVSNSKKNDQLLKEDIPMNFGDASIYLKKNGENTEYIFDGINYSMHCYLENGIFKVIKMQRLASYYREKNKKTYLPLGGQICFQEAYSRNIIDNNNFELSNRLLDHMQTLRSKKNINNEYDNAFGFWHTFIKIMIDDAQKQALRFNYKAVKEGKGFLYFELQNDSCTGDDSLTSETTFVFEREDKNGNLKTNEIGRFEGYADDGNTLVIKRTNGKIAVPRSGTFCVDYHKEIKQHRAQEKALDEFRRDETNNNHSMKAIIVGLEPPNTFPALSSIKYFDEKLDDAQRRAVCKVIEAEDIALIQGPPGTGKTNVIVEVIRQILRYNKKNPIVAQKVLIVSQAHAAVDKIIEDLDQYLVGVNAIRIGRDDSNFSELAREKYALENRKKIWIKNIICNSQAQLQSNLNKMQIPEVDFDLFANALGNLRIINNNKEDTESYKTIVNTFYRKYNISEDNAVFQQQIICYNWIKQLEETQEIEEYFIKNATIIFGTCAGFASNPFISDIVFDYVIVDEAAKATLPEIMISLVKANKVILVGDQMQLPPVFDQGVLERAEKKIDIETLKNGGFGKIFDVLPDSVRETLSTQYRMHPCIGDMISAVFYGNTIQTGVSIEQRTLNLPQFENTAMLWVSTSNIPKDRRSEQKSITATGKESFLNPLEVKILLEYIMKVDDEMGFENYSVGIITPYRAQVDLIEKRIKLLNLKKISVEVNTVDAFQGSQKDIILYSTVRSWDNGKIGFLKEHARLNVSFSRAKSLLIIVGDLDYLNNSKIPENKFPDIIKYMISNQKFCHIIQYRSDKK